MTHEEKMKEIERENAIFEKMFHGNIALEIDELIDEIMGKDFESKLTETGKEVVWRLMSSTIHSFEFQLNSLLQELGSCVDEFQKE